MESFNLSLLLTWANQTAHIVVLITKSEQKVAQPRWIEDRPRFRLIEEGVGERFASGTERVKLSNFIKDRESDSFGVNLKHPCN